MVSRCARSPKNAGVAASPASSCHGSKKDDRMMPFGIFSVPNTSTVSYWPARMEAAASIERGATAGTARFDVDDGHPRHAEPAEDLVAGGHAAVGGAAEGGLKAALADAGFPQRGADGVHPHVGRGHALETPERVHDPPR